MRLRSTLNSIHDKKTECICFYQHWTYIFPIIKLCTLDLEHVYGMVKTEGSYSPMFPMWWARRGHDPHPYFLIFFFWMLCRPTLRHSLRSSSILTMWPFVTDESSSWRTFARYRTGRIECGESIQSWVRRWRQSNCPATVAYLHSFQYWYRASCRLGRRTVWYSIEV
jgi:hypothetical protein